MPLSSMISTRITVRCAADPELVGTRFSSGLLATVMFMVFRFAMIAETTSTKQLPSMSLAALLLLSSPASAGPPFITDDPEPTNYQHWELYVFSLGTHEMGETSGVAPPSSDFNYGIVLNVQLHIQPGMAFANGTPLHLGQRRRTNSPGTSASN